MAHLFEPLAMRDLVLRNRIAVPAMCQYSACDGLANDWHFGHYGSRAVGGAALIISEATSVVPEGRISPADLGLWDDGQIEPLARIVRFALEQGCPMAVQLAHAGRKASVGRGWEPAASIPAGDGGWPVVAPSPIPPRSAPTRRGFPPSRSTPRTATCCTSSFRRSPTGAPTATAAASPIARGSPWRSSMRCVRSGRNGYR